MDKKGTFVFIKRVNDKSDEKGQSRNSKVKKLLGILLIMRDDHNKNVRLLT